MILKEIVLNLAQEALSDDNQFLVDVVVSGHGPQKITIVLDGDRGITIDDCAAISRHLVSRLEEQTGGRENYSLEVTTPGLDHPLKLTRQYTKNIGREMKVQLKDKTMELGRLVAVNEGSIALEREEKEDKRKVLKIIELPFSEIERALVQVSFK
jgi:ribosome maturation factor RimP